MAAINHSSDVEPLADLHISYLTPCSRPCTHISGYFQTKKTKSFPVQFGSFVHTQQIFRSQVKNFRTLHFTVSVHAGGLFQFLFDAFFVCDVPYELTSWSFYISLDKSYTFILLHCHYMEGERRQMAFSFIQYTSPCFHSGF